MLERLAKLGLLNLKREHPGKSIEKSRLDWFKETNNDHFCMRHIIGGQINSLSVSKKINCRTIGSF